jgi:excisionase family DNA binding protein
MSQHPHDNMDADQLLTVLQRIEAHLAALRNDTANGHHDWLTLEQAAEELSVSRDTVDRMISSGQLRVATISTQAGRGFRNRYRVRREWLEQCLVEKRQVKTPESRRRSHRSNGSKIDYIG